MATLHVRNVPDDLYEELRVVAEADGRSIGAEAISLLRGALAERDAMYEGMRRAIVERRSPFHRHFAESAKDLVLRAQALARELGAPEVTPAHVLLAMLEDDALRPTLVKRGITVESVRAALVVGEPREGPTPVSADARRMLERALLASLEV
jgi:plasmid stability protein